MNFISHTAAFVLGCATVVSTLASAEAYPQKTIVMVAPFPPGGAVDAIGRILAEDLANQLGQPVIMETLPGAGGIIGATKVARAKPDGYTLLLNNMSQSTVSTFNSSVPYDPFKDFTSLGSVAYIPMVLYARNDFEGDAASILKVVQANPAKFSVANNGVGSTTYLCQAQFQQSVGAKGVVEVAYKGSGPALMDLAGGVVDLACDTMLGAGALLRANKVKAVAVASSGRLAGYPEIPTFQELGYKNMDIPLWVAVYGPKGMPAAIRDTLSGALQKAVESPRVKERIAKLDASPEQPTAATSTALDERMRSEAARWKSLAKR